MKKDSSIHWLALGFGAQDKAGEALRLVLFVAVAAAVVCCPSAAQTGTGLKAAAMTKPARASRNKDLVRGVGRNGRSKTYHKRGLWAIKAKNGGSFPTHEKVAAAAPAAVRAPKFYPADDVPKPLHKNKVINAPKLR